MHVYEDSYSGMVCAAMVEREDGSGDQCGLLGDDPVHMQLDGRGIPTETNASGTAAPYCPPKPCELCKGNAADGTPSWEWCQEMKTCGATIDWEKVYGRS